MKAAEGSPFSVVSELVTPRIVIFRPSAAPSRFTLGNSLARSDGRSMPFRVSASPVTTLMATGVPRRQFRRALGGDEDFGKLAVGRGGGNRRGVDARADARDGSREQGAVQANPIDQHYKFPGKT